MENENSEAVSVKTSLTADIVAAYVSNNRVAHTELPAVVEMVFSALDRLVSGVEPAAEPEPLVPAVSVKKSIEPDFIICLEDGKRFKSLKRHLATHFDLTPDEYRRKWGLPMDYPMVAPNYAAARSALAKNMGLGRKAGIAEPEMVEETPAPAPEEAAPPAPKRRASRKPALVAAPELESEPAPEPQPAPEIEIEAEAPKRRRAPRKAKAAA